MDYHRQLITSTDREEFAQGTTYHLRYSLYRESTPTGGQFYAVACHMTGWQANRLVCEDWDISGGLGCDPNLALNVYHHVSEAGAPVFPCHLAEIVHDQAVAGLRPSGLGLSHCLSSPAV